MPLLTTVARAKRHPALAGVEAVHLTNLLTAAGDWVENYCGRVFASTAYAPENHDGSGDDMVFVHNPPITLLTNIIITDSNEDTETILGAEFTFDADIGLIKFDPVPASDYTWFPVGFQNIAVTYTGGWAVIPDDVQEASIKVAAQMYGSLAVSAPWLKSEKIGEYSRTLADTAQSVTTKEVTEMLAPRRLWAGRS